MTRIPVVIAGTSCLSGVTTWAENLRRTLANHPRYDVTLLHVGEGGAPHSIVVNSVEEAYRTVCQMGPIILVPNYYWELYLAAFEPGVNCLGMCHSDSEEEYYRPLSWYEPMVSQFIGVSRECAARLQERFSFRANDVTTLPYGIPLPWQLDRTYRTNPLRLVYAGRVTQLQKRVWDFVPLVEHLLKLRVRFVFDIVGEGDEYESLRAAMIPRFAGYVRFHPRVSYEQMADIWSTHDVLVQTSDFEGTSVSMLEAMAYGAVPVVTAASSGIEGVIRHDENGFVVPVGDMGSMAQFIAHLATNPQRLAAVGAAAHESAQNYSLDRYGDRFVDVLDRIVDTSHCVNIYERYGMFAGQHPTLKQNAIISQLQSRIAYLEQNPIKRLAARMFGPEVRTRLHIAERPPRSVWQQRRRAA